MAIAKSDLGSRNNDYNNVSITALAEKLSKLSAQLTAYLDRNGHGHPDFTPNTAPPPETYEYQALRNQISDATMDMHRLVNGPLMTIHTLSFAHSHLAAFQVALSRKYFHIVPDNGIGLSAVEIAREAGMDEDRTRRILKILANQRTFQEVNGKFRHTANSAFMKTSLYASMAGAALDDVMKASAEMNSWIDESPYETGLENSPFFKRFHDTFYGYYEKNPEKGLRFSNAMTAWTLIDDSAVFLHDNYPWASLQNPQVIDVGGGNGHVSIDLARDFPNLTFTVQDLSPQQLSTAQTAEVGSRVSFTQYNYFTPQPIHTAGVYMFRNAFHNQNDANASTMLKALIPALENRTDDPKILINDVVLAETAGVPAIRGGKEIVTRAEEHAHRMMDLAMLSLFGAKERTERDWEVLFKDVDARLEIVSMIYNSRGAGLIEVRLKN